MKKLENKKEMIKAARVALAMPGEKSFWEEVKQRMDIRQQDLVKARKLAH